MPRNTLYVTGFSKDSKAADLAPDFEKFGELVRLDIPPPRTDDGEKYAFVEYKEPESCEKAMELDGKTLPYTTKDGLVVQVARSDPYSIRSSSRGGFRGGRGGFAPRGSYGAPRGGRGAYGPPRGGRGGYGARGGYGYASRGGYGGYDGPRGDYEGRGGYESSRGGYGGYRDGPRDYRDDPRGGYDDPRESSSDGPRDSAREPRDAPREPRDGPRDGPREPRDGPREPRDGPREPRGYNDRDYRGPRGSQLREPAYDNRSNDRYDREDRGGDRNHAGADYSRGKYSRSPSRSPSRRDRSRSPSRY